jgi:hypothetical protein
VSPSRRRRTPQEDRHNRPTPEEIRAMRERIKAHAKEVMGHMYQAMLKTPEFSLRDGTKCRVDPFYEPQVDSGGDLKCGFDVLLDDGSHLEFTVGQTGWGKSLARGHAGKETRRGRGR